MWRFGVLALTLLLGGCSSCAKESKDEPASVDAAISPRPRTTSGDLALGNLNAEVDVVLASNVPRDKIRAVAPLLSRAHYLGKVADLELAHQVAFETEADAGDTHYARAAVLSALHRFDAALKELDAASAAGWPIAPHVNGTRSAVFIARGQYDDALALQPPNIDERDSLSIAHAAILACKMQKTAECERLFALARARFKDVSPFTLAWIDFQHGALLELAGEDAKARAWFEEATEVLPRYAHAALHLATAEAPAAAIARLTKIRETSDDPEVLVVLAAAHKRAGRDAEAAPLLDQAKRRYEEILAKFPEAFADHGARFYLNAGDDPARALELAKLNAKNRVTEESLDLWMAAAAGAKNNAEVCLAVHRMAALAYLSPRGKALVNGSRANCGD